MLCDTGSISAREALPGLLLLTFSSPGSCTDGVGWFFTMQVTIISVESIESEVQQHLKDLFLPLKTLK